jgi:methylated-DNA-protein-cysteine methyltransferase-like protein
MRGKPGGAPETGRSRQEAPETSRGEQKAAKTSRLERRTERRGVGAVSRSRDDAAPRASALYEALWAVVRRIPPGRVATYGQISALAGRPGQPRLAGYALHSLPAGSDVPWHRVVNAKGEISTRGRWLGGEEGYQQALLEAEGVRFDAWGRIDLESHQWRPRSLGGVPARSTRGPARRRKGSSATEGAPRRKGSGARRQRARPA